MVRAGYKQTEVGEIPEDWATENLGSICIKIQDGTHFSPKITGGDYLYITSKNIKNGRLWTESADYINAEEHQKIYSRCAVKKNDILLTKDGANTGNAAINHLEEEFSLLSSVAMLRLDSRVNEPRYFLQSIISSDGQTRLKGQMAGNAITRLTLEKIRALKFSVPKLDEQRAIADALSDVDALIGSLEKLVAKKRDIKTATMQQLLTGKKRLPGYYEKWTSSKLGEIGQFRKGKGIRKNEVLDSGLPCVRYGEIYTRHHDYIKKFYSFISPAVASEASIIKAGDLLFAGSGETSEEIGKCVAYLSNDHAFAGGDIVIYRAPDQDAKYLGFLMNHESVVVQKMQMGQGDAVVHIHAKNIAGIEVCLPPIDEQQAISDVLSDMDFEIGELEKRLAKTKDIKQGMMQELLTGRTRLV